MYKVGDEVLVKGEIVSVDEEVPYPVEVRVCACSLPLCFTEEELKLATKTYEQGLADAWELAKKIVLKAEKGGFNYDDFVRIFGIGDYTTLFEKMTVEEALAKIEAYEKEKEIKVGDVVRCESHICVVTHLVHNNAYVMWDDGSNGCYKLNDLKKTGKHIDIELLLRQIGE